MTQAYTEVAIIGAGTSGCLIANLLNETGLDCLLLEKSRGLGGRCSRRLLHNDASIDLGAPYFSVNEHNLILRDKIRTWLHLGYLSEWGIQPKSFDGQAGLEPSREHQVLCATPSMNAFHKYLAKQINTLTNCEVDTLKKVSGLWQIFDKSGQLIRVARTVIITAPAEQAWNLLKYVNADISDFNACQSSANSSLPQFVCTIAFSKPLKIDSHAYENGHFILQSAIHESAKPGRANLHALGDVWTLHSTHEWAQQHSEKHHKQVAVELIQAFCQHFGLDIKPSILTSHYWRLAQHSVSTQPPTLSIWNDDLQLGCCADWLAGGGISGALASALSLSQNITQSFKIEA